MRYKIVYFHLRIWRCYRNSLDNFCRPRYVHIHSFRKFHHLSKTDHRIGNERIIYEFHCLSHTNTSHILEIRSHSGKYVLNSLKDRPFSTDKYRKFSCYSFWSTSSYWCIDEMHSNFFKIMSNIMRPLYSNSRHIDKY